MSAPGPRVAVVTVVAGRHAHLRAQRRGLAAAHPRPHEHVVVALGDPAIAARRRRAAGLPTTWSSSPTRPAGLPVAAARNRGAAAALAAGADVVVFLDVDCIPDPCLVGAYRDAVAARPGRPALRSGHLPAAGARRRLDGRGAGRRPRAAPGPPRSAARAVVTR